MFPFLLNKISKIDRNFFLIILGIIVLCVAIYFLIPVINRKQYKTQRENLQKREEVFKANLRSNQQPNVEVVTEEASKEEK